MKFDTSSIPDDAVVTAVQLEIFAIAHQDTNAPGVTFVAEARGFDWGAVVDAGDCTPGTSMGAFPLLATLNVPSAVTFPAPPTSIFTENGTTFQDYINLTGDTTFALWSSRTRIGNAVALNSSEAMTFGNGNGPLSPGCSGTNPPCSRPQLTVTFELTTQIIAEDATIKDIHSVDSSYLLARSCSGSVSVNTHSASSISKVGQKNTGTSFEIYHMPLRFDTSGIPDGVDITSSELKLFGRLIDAQDDTFVIEARGFDWGSTVEVGDCVSGAAMGSSELLASFDTAGWTVDGFNVFTNNGNSLDDYIDPTGFTTFMLWSRDTRLGLPVPTNDSEFVAPANGAGLFGFGVPTLTVNFVPVLDVSAISPETGEDNEAVVVTVTGLLFDTTPPGADLVLTRIGQPDIDCTGEAVTATEIIATCDLNGVATGFWNVKVTNPDLESATLANGFEVLLSTPNVVAIAPTQGSNFAAVSLVVTGSGFFVGGPAALTLKKTAEPDIVCTGFAVSGGGTQIDAICDITGVATGLWDVEVTDDLGDTDTLTAAFLVFQPVPNEVNQVAWSQNPGDFLATAHVGSPSFTVLEFDTVNGEFEGRPSDPPASVPTGDGHAVEFSPDGKVIVVGTENAGDVLYAYDFDDVTGVVGDIPTVPGAGVTTGKVNDVAFTPDSAFLAVAHETSPFHHIYTVVTSDVPNFFPTVVTTAATGSSAVCHGADFHPDGTFVAFACNLTPFMFVFEFDDTIPDFDTQLSDPATLPSGPARAVQFSPDGDYIALAITSSPFIEVWNFDKSLGVIGAKVTAPVSLPAGSGFDVDWLNTTASTETALALAHDTTPFVTVYVFDRIGAAFGSKLSSPSTLPDGNANSVQFHAADDFLAVGHETSEFLSVYEYNGPASTFFRVDRTFLPFDTSGLPDTLEIQSATLRIFGASDNSDTDFTIRVQDGSGLTTPFAVADYDQGQFNGNLGTLSSAGWVTGSFNQITLTDFSTIDPTGETIFVLGSEEDINNSAPAGDEYVTIRTAETVNPAELAITFLEDADVLTATGITTGEHRLTISSDGSLISLDVDGINLASGSPFGVPDSSADWVFWENNTLPYVESMTIEVDGIQELFYQLNTTPGIFLLDRSPTTGNDGLMSFPVGSPTLVTSEEALASTRTPELLRTEAGIPQIAAELEGIPNLAGTEEGTGLPLFGLFSELDSASGIPVRFFWIVIATGFALFAGGAVMVMTQNLVYAAVAMGAMVLTAGLIGVGILPIWVFIIFGFMAAGLVALQRRVLA